MEINWYIISVIIGSAIVTFIPRVLPLVVLSKLEIPEWGINWLKHVPVAVMAALLASELLLHDNKIALQANSLSIITAIPTLLVAIYTKSLLGTVLVGVSTLMIFRYLL
ncbi:AzlD domain-containing protein [Peribacillus huizhouensis]|uniref:Branched-subunit amino acid transport protein n=1 Tax=Peribacillus huizhouensis TaxID=1501239 RepID=A0ABR6CPW5_9BACI|nr:AzlD domain-containing protein [Peribacillus huizhouensis]MBA9027077.1 branched-subunit amino acid transport protein [Peribacillus huizhouensis]